METLESYNNAIEEDRMKSYTPAGVLCPKCMANKEEVEMLVREQVGNKDLVICPKCKYANTKLRV